MRCDGRESDPAKRYPTPSAVSFGTLQSKGRDSVAILSAKWALALAGSAIACGALEAQVVAAKPSSGQPSSYLPPWEYWTGSMRLAPGSRIFVVTDAEPARRQFCRVRSIDSSQLECARHHGVAIFQRGDVEALIAPGAREHWKASFGLILGACTATIVVGTLLSIVGGPAVIILGSLLIVGPPAFAIGASRQPDQLLYCKTGTCPTVSLHR